MPSYFGRHLLNIPNECQGWSEEIFLYRNQSACRLLGGICQQLFSIVCKLSPCFEKTSAESGVNVGMFSEICLDVFLSFVQK